MTSHNATFSPIRWVPATQAGEQVQGVWTKELLRSPDGDSFTLLRIGHGAKFELSGGADDRILVLDGELVVSAGDEQEEGTSHRSGAYCGLPAGGTAVVSTPDRCLALILNGERLGDPADDVFGPDGWHEWSPGQWSKALLEVEFDENFDERIVGLAHFEPGSVAPRHPHQTAHRFLFLDGEADDELVFPDGTRQTAHRARGDFVDYPYPIEHQSFSKTGCTILFLHEPIAR
ncbi:cupin domain-containing protein [Streptomyces sp. DW26H14]|uniref:cupin domain-containing protein n=1 Tax=Streptomyces sp. DW26H14 TaxID=3435395 RepID=UPI00403DBF62